MIYYHNFLIQMAEKLGSRHCLPIANKSPPRPDLQSHEKLIRIRPYRPSDSEQVRELFMIGFMHGRMFLNPIPSSSFLIFYLAHSAVKVMYKDQWKGPTACVSYCSLGLGILLATFPTSLRMRHIGIALCITGCALFVALRGIFFYMISNATKQALNGDLKDIGKTFGMDPVVNHNGEKTGEYAPSGSSGFWVAEAYEKGSEIDESKTRIVGSVGIGIVQSYHFLHRPNLILR